MTTDRARELLEAAARQFAHRRYEAVSLPDIADEAVATVAEVSDAFPTVRDAAIAVLTAEGSSMREAQRRASAESDDPLRVLERTFALVGDNMANSLVVRAGMRLAAESRQHVPERNIDPYRTWSSYLIGLLEEANRRGQLRSGLDVPAVAWLFVATAIGAKELISFQNAWPEAEARLGDCAAMLIDAIRAHPKHVPETPGRR